AELSDGGGQLHSGQSAADPGTYRSRVVLPALLRDAARRAIEARRRLRALWLDPAHRFPALARHIARPLGHVPARLSVVPLCILRRRDCTRLSGVAGTCRLVRDLLAALHLLVFLPSPGHHAIARLL